MPVKVVVVAGARPNFMKIALLVNALRKAPRFRVKLVHTGQHYDYRMSDIFFKELRIPRPDVHLSVGSGTHAEQTARIMERFERVVWKDRPDLVVVVGDVNSTLACALVASKLGIRVAHVEAGLRSFDRTMPEELNRIVTDRLSDLLFVSEESGLKNLKREGIAPEKVFFVGNTMIDSLLANLKAVEASKVLVRLGLRPRAYAAVTLHRPSNVDTKAALVEVSAILGAIAARMTVVYPIHPRTLGRLKSHGLLGDFKRIRGLKMIEPLGYVDFVRLVKDSRFVLTDSGGIQEESTVLKVPCLTLRQNTERPVTVRLGTNCLVKRNKKEIMACVERILAGRWKKGSVPERWDGKTTGRILAVLRREGRLRDTK